MAEAAAAAAESTGARKAAAAASATSGPYIDPKHHQLLIGQSHRFRSEIDRLKRLDEQRAASLREAQEAAAASAARASAAESRRDAAESMTIRLMALNKSLLDHYQHALTRRDEQRATRQMAVLVRPIFMHVHPCSHHIPHTACVPRTTRFFFCFFLLYTPYTELRMNARVVVMNG